MVRTSLNDPSYRVWQQRLSRGIEAQYHRSRLLQRDLAEVHSAKQRKADTKRIGNTIAAKFGVITVDQVRINYAKRQGNEMQQARASLGKALIRRDNRAKARAQAAKMWIMDHHKKLYKRFKGQGHIFDLIAMYLAELEEVETEDE